MAERNYHEKKNHYINFGGGNALDHGAFCADIMLSIKQIKTLDSFAKLDKPTEPENWAMPGHMVNVCYDHFVNDITFPAAIL